MIKKEQTLLQLQQAQREQREAEREAKLVALEAEREQRASEKEAQRTAARNCCTRQQLISEENRPAQVVAETHAVSQRNGNRIASDLLMAALTIVSDEEEHIPCEHGQVQASPAPPPSPPPSPPTLPPTPLHQPPPSSVTRPANSPPPPTLHQQPNN